MKFSPKIVRKLVSKVGRVNTHLLALCIERKNGAPARKLVRRWMQARKLHS